MLHTGGGDAHGNGLRACGPEAALARLPSRRPKNCFPEQLPVQPAPVAHAPAAAPASGLRHAEHCAPAFSAAWPCFRRTCRPLHRLHSLQHPSPRPYLQHPSPRPYLQHCGIEFCTQSSISLMALAVQDATVCYQAGAPVVACPMSMNSRPSVLMMCRLHHSCWLGKRKQHLSLWRLVRRSTQRTVDGSTHPPACMSYHHLSCIHY
jgi:hypothetical protein